MNGLTNELEEEFFAVEGEAPDYSAAIALLEAERERLDETIGALRALHGRRPPRPERDLERAAG